MAAKTIIVTGAGRGIGLAVSQYLLQNSHKVVLVARTETELEALKKQYPAQVEYLAADLAKLENATKVTDLAVKLGGGKVDGIVINHGALEPIKPIADSTVDEWKTIYDINFFSPLALVQAVIPKLRQTKGRIIVTSSGAATKGYKAWGPCKHHIHTLICSRIQHLGARSRTNVTIRRLLQGRPALARPALGGRGERHCFRFAQPGKDGYWHAKALARAGQGLHGRQGPRCLCVCIRGRQAQPTRGSWGRDSQACAGRDARLERQISAVSPPALVPVCRGLANHARRWNGPELTSYRD